MPTDDRYYFHIKRVGPEYQAAFSFKSLKTNKFLHCSNDGKVFLEEVNHPANEECKDRRTWFRCMWSSQIQQQDFWYESTSPGEGNSQDVQKQGSEDLAGGNSEDPGKEKCDGPGREESKDPEGEVNHEDLTADLKEGHHGESENGNLTVLSKNSSDLEGTENSDEKKTSE